MPPMHESGGMTWEFTVSNAIGNLMKSQWDYVALGGKVMSAMNRIFGGPIKPGIDYRKD